MLKPAIKLLEFFRAVSEADLDMSRQGRIDAETGGLATFATDKAQSVSRTIREVAPIGVKDVDLWVSYWSSVGLFD